MDILQQMIDTLSPMRLYNLNENSIVYSELYAQSIPLQEADDELSVMLKELFIETAEDYGLLNIEKLYSPGYTEKTADERRKMINRRLSINQGDFTLQGFTKMLESLGAQGKASEYPARQELIAEISSVHSVQEQAYIRQELSKLLPCHIVCYIYFGGKTWGELEKQDLTFGEIDLMGITWQTFDNME